MSKKVKVLISVVVAVLLLTIGTTAVVMAQEEPAPEPRANGLLARVAGILDIPEEDLITTFKQARQEIRQEMRQAWQERRQEAFLKAIDKAVEEGLITQDEADEIIEWWEQRPEALGQIRQACPSADPGSGDGNMWNKRWHSAFGMRGDDGGWHCQGQCQQGNGA